MAENTRWTAMYTKHIKQKRKVMLYDEANNLLDSRMLKADEVVSSGETLTLQAYLVDIYDPMEEQNKAPSVPKVEPSDQGCTRKPFAVIRPNFKKSSLHCVEKKPNLVNDLSSKSPSPSHKMIIGTVPLVSADKESNNHSFINSPCDDSRLENDILSKDVPPHKPLRDVNQILSILQKRNVTETCSNNNSETSYKKVPPESNTNKIPKIECFTESCISTCGTMYSTRNFIGKHERLLNDSSPK